MRQANTGDRALGQSATLAASLGQAGASDEQMNDREEGDCADDNCLKSRYRDPKAPRLVVVVAVQKGYRTEMVVRETERVWLRENRGLWTRLTMEASKHAGVGPGCGSGPKAV